MYGLLLRGDDVASAAVSFSGRLSSAVGAGMSGHTKNCIVNLQVVVKCKIPGMLLLCGKFRDFLSFVFEN